MANQLQIFNNKEFGEVRVMTINEKEWFIAKDIAKALGYARERDAIARHCKKAKEFKELNQGGVVSQPLTIQPQTKLIPESDIYRLIMKSRLLTAEKFEEWVMEEVLPSIRKNGSYSVEVTAPLPTTEIGWIEYALTLAKDKQQLKEANKEKQLLIEEQKPKVDFYDTVAISKTGVELKIAAKVLNMILPTTGKTIGRTDLFAILRERGILDLKNKPYQKYIDNGYFRLIQKTYTQKHRDGTTTQEPYTQTLLHSKGIDQ